MLAAAGCAVLPGSNGGRDGAAGTAGDDASPGPTIFEDIDDRILLGPAGRGIADNDHPVRLSPRTLRTRLAGLEARLEPSRSRGLFEDGEATTVPVFTDATLDAIAKPLAAAFERASAGQDVLLQVTQRRAGDRLKVAGERVVTTARLFHRDGKLNVVFGAVDAKAEGVASTEAANSPKSGSYRSPGAQPSGRFPMGSRERAAALQARLQAEQGVEDVPAGRTDWLVLDVRAVDAGTGAADAAASEVAADDPAGETPAPLPERADALEDLDAATLERLRELRELRRQDLISAPAYESMVRELLGLGARDDD